MNGRCITSPQFVGNDAKSKKMSLCEIPKEKSDKNYILSLQAAAVVAVDPLVACTKPNAQGNGNTNSKIIKCFVKYDAE